MSENKFPRGIELVVGALIERNDGRILITKSPKWAGKWTVPGGHIDSGESILNAAKREGEEETGLALEPVSIICHGENIDSREFHRSAHFIFFICHLKVIGGEICLQENELTESAWVLPEEALHYDLTEIHPRLIQAFIDIQSEK